MKTLFIVIFNLLLPTYAFAALELDLDLDHKVSKFFDKDGGVLQTEDANGQVITLTIPAGALTQKTEITLTPLKAIKGIAMENGLKAGAHLEPDGLELGKMAELSIVLKNPVNPKASLPLHYRQNRNTYNAQAMFIDKNQIRFPIHHFSGYAEGEGSAENWQALKSQPVANPADQLAQDYAVIVKQHEEGFYKTEEEFQKAVDDLFNKVKNGSYADLLKQFGTGPNCGVEKSRMRSINSILRQTALLGANDWPTLDSDILAKIFKRCTNELERACTDRHDPALTQNLLQFAREAAVLGHSELEEYASAAAKRCGTFQVVFESRLDITSRRPIWDKFTSYYLTNWPKELMSAPEGEDQKSEVTAEGDFDYTRGLKNCKTTWKFVPDPVIFNQLKVETTSRYGEGTEDVPFDLPAVDLIDFTLRYMPGSIEEKAHTECTHSPPVDLNTQWWYIHFFEFHKREHIAGYMWAKNFKMMPIGGSLIAEKDYDDTTTDSRGTFHQITTIKIYHSPGAQ